MATIEKNRKIFCITEGTVRNLAREMDLPKDRFTPELLEKVKEAILIEFRDWDSWLKEVIARVVDEGTQ